MTITMSEQPFARWLWEEMKRRNMSVREFGVLVDVPHSTLNNILNGKIDSYPRIETLVKISRATNMDLCTLVSMVAPEDAKIDSEVMVWATRLKHLSPEKKKILDAFLIGSDFKP